MTRLPLLRWIDTAALSLCLVVALVAPKLAFSLSFDCQALEGDGDGPFWIHAGDWNGDGRNDLAVTYVRTGTLSSFVSTGNRTFKLSGSWEVGKVPRGTDSGDVNRDGHVDLAVANATSHDAIILLGDGTGKFSVGTSVAPGMAPFHPRLIDLDHDGALDLVVVNESNWSNNSRPGTIAIFKGTANGQFTKSTDLIAGQNPAAMQFVDVNRDSILDLVVANWESVSISSFLGRSDGSFAAAVESKYQGGAVYWLAPFDFDGDGIIDLATPDLQGIIHVLKGAGDGSFVEVGGVKTNGSGTRHVEVVDIDQDGHADLVASNMATHDLAIFRGRSDHRFEPPVVLKVGSRPRMVLANDIDGDGLIDLAVANQGERRISLLFQSRRKGKPCPAALVPKRGTATDLDQSSTDTR